MTVINDNDIEQRMKMEADATANAVLFDNSAHNTTSVAHSNSASLVSIDPSVLQSIRYGEPVVDPNERQADLCFGCCCDFRRACKIVNIEYLFELVFKILLASLTGSDWLDSLNFDRNDYDDDDDSLEANIDTLDAMKSYTIFLLIMFVIGTPSAVIGIIGAETFNKYMVLSTGICYCILVILNCYTKNWPYVVVRGLFAYPHFALFMALKSGKITRENYMVEKHCCCDAKPDV